LIDGWGKGEVSSFLSFLPGEKGVVRNSEISIGDLGKTASSVPPAKAEVQKCLENTGFLSASAYFMPAHQ
jgi:hypothetical protein